ncbi:MAG TPA: BREX protein BrxB domain-containing protein [Polyangia bacterium]|nr:BREX protein BrxB domain-containing protein [Polyangia bacterium]
MSDFEQRLRQNLEPVLALHDPRERISAYHDMPYALFHYEPEDEFELRNQVTQLETRLTNVGKRVRRISLAKCLERAMAMHAPLERLVEAEKDVGLEAAIQTVHEILATYAPLVNLVAAEMPPNPNPMKDVVLIVRTGALFPVYRTFSLLEQLKGRVIVPTVLFYPGCLDGAAGLRFMCVLDAEHNYRPKIF